MSAHPEPGSVTEIEGKKAVVLPKNPILPPSYGFQGWAFDPDEPEEPWECGPNWVGSYDSLIYAAPIDSEVVRMNFPHLAAPEKETPTSNLEEIRSKLGDGTPTPRTDASAFRVYQNWENKGDHSRECVFADDARTLERETTAQAARIAELEKQISRMAEDARHLAMKEITLYDLSVRNGAITAEVGSEVCQVMAAQFAEVLKERGGENYMEMHLTHPKHEGEKLVVTLRWHHGKTPHEMRQKAEAERDRMRGLISRALPTIHHAQTLALAKGYNGTAEGLGEIIKEFDSALATAQDGKERGS